MESDVLPLEVPIGLTITEAAVQVLFDPLEQRARRALVGGVPNVQLAALPGHLAGQLFLLLVPVPQSLPFPRTTRLRRFSPSVMSALSAVCRLEV
jgi:hypothetical protein